MAFHRLLVLTSVVWLVACSTTNVAPAAPAVAYELQLCGPGNHNCQVVSEHPSSGSCETARKAYLKEYPGANVGCMKQV